MATWIETRYERPAPTNRWRDALVMAVFSLAALAAAFAFVQLKYGDGNPDAASPPRSVAATAGMAPSQAERARTSMQLAAAAADAGAEALSAVRTELARVRGDLEAAKARISQLEAAVHELQAAPADDRRAEPDAPPISRPEAAAGSDAPPAAPPTGAERRDAGTAVPAHVKSEDIASSRRKPTRYSVEDGDTAAQIANRYCLSLADLLRLNRDVADANALAVGQTLVVEDRCVASSSEAANQS